MFLRPFFLNEHNRIVGELEPLVASNSKTKKLPDYKKQEVVFQVSGIPIIENLSATISSILFVIFHHADPRITKPES